MSTMSSSVLPTCPNGSNNSARVPTAVPIPKELIIDNAENYRRQIDLQALGSRLNHIGPRRSNRQRTMTFKVVGQENDKADTNSASSGLSNGTTTTPSSRKRKVTGTNIGTQASSSVPAIDNGAVAEQPTKKRRTSATKVVVEKKKTERLAALDNILSPKIKHKGIAENTFNTTSSTTNLPTNDTKKDSKSEPTRLQTKPPRRPSPKTPTVNGTKNRTICKTKRNSKSGSVSENSNTSNTSQPFTHIIPERRSTRIATRKTRISKCPTRLALEARLRSLDNHGVVRPFSNGDAVQPPNAEDHQAVVEDIIRNEYLMDYLTMRREQDAAAAEEAGAVAKRTGVEFHTGDTTDDDDDDDEEELTDDSSDVDVDVDVERDAMEEAARIIVSVS